MSKVIILDELTAAQIAAGEVIERPASVVKETVENSLDAGATSVYIEIKNGGIRYIRVTDNGSGFEKDDAVIAFEKHATSKLRCGADLDNIQTLGFRGEALASIAAVADVDLVSRTAEASDGIHVRIKGGELLEQNDTPCARGTVLTVRELFYNTPARYKFLKKDQTEASYVCDVVQKLAIANPHVSFRLVSNGQEILNTPGNGDLKSAVYSVYGRETAQDLLTVDHYEQGSDIKVYGFIGVRNAVYGSRARQTWFVNGRNIKNKLLTAAIDEAYKTVTMTHKYPFTLLLIEVPATKLDVNVHPAKTEVRFADESDVYKAVLHAVNNALFVKNQSGGATSAQPASTQPASAPHRAAVLNVKPVDNLAEKAQPVDKSVDKPVDLWKSPYKTGISRNVDIPVTSKNDEKQALEEYYGVMKENVSFVAEEGRVSRDLSEQITVPEQKSGTYNDKGVYTESRIIGQAFETYILLQYGEQIAMIDQHAAHERLMYERIRSALEKADETPPSAPMLVPVVMKLTPAEATAMESAVKHFTKMGFEIEEFGINSYIIRAVPAFMVGADYEAVILDGLAGIEDGKGLRASFVNDRAVYTMACKAAVKANQALSEAECKELLLQLSRLDNSATCPHGRPIVIYMTKQEIEKRFKR